MKHRILATAALVCAAALAQAAAPTFWQVSTEAEFLRGEVENLSIDPFGRLTLGPATTTVYESTAPFLWTAITLADGTIFVGSGNEGQVHKIDASGRGTVFFDAQELEVHALAAAPNGGLYVGTSPEGRVYRVDATGKSEVFFDPPDRYIWSLVVDRTGTVFAGTGDKGVIYKIPPDGKGVPFYETKATHAMSLALDRDGLLLAGTESPGRVFRIDAAGKPFVLLDSSYNEIHALRVDAAGNIYAAAVGTRGASGSQDADPSPAPEPASQPIATVSTEITVVAVAEPAATAQSSSSPAPRAAGPRAGAVFRITPDGAWDLLWDSREDTPYDVAFDAGGDLLVATGNKGKIYRLSGDPYRPTLVARANAQQVTTLLRDRDGRMLYASSNPGKLFRLSPGRAERGTYTSDIRDAQTVASWGVIKWRAAEPAGTRIEIATRTGNTRTPDETWSDWSTAYTNAEGSSITSPRARYLQWRAVLTAARADAPLLTSVTAAYLPRNIRPRVTGITIHPPGTVFQRPFPVDPEIAGFDGDLADRRNIQQPGAGSSPALGRRAYQRGLLTFMWRGEDENRDELTYDVMYRREGETAWKPLKRGVPDQILVWDTTSVPNGRYMLRVVASDGPSNSPATALSGAMESTTFDIDNLPPVITITGTRREGTRTIVTFDVRDEHSSVQKADYSLDGDRWQTIYPRDGIPDSRAEQFELVLEGEAAARGVVIRAADALNNLSSTRGDATPAR